MEKLRLVLCYSKYATMKKTIMCVFLHTFSSYFTLFSSEWCDLH